MPRRPRCLVLGAGPAGLITLRELLAVGADVQLLERSDDLGGVYAAGRVYEGAVLTTSSNLTAFGCYPAPHPEAPAMWTTQEYVAYLRDFARANNLLPHIHFGRTVMEVRLQEGEGAAAVTVRSVATQRGSGGDDAEEMHYADHVILATGLNTHAPSPHEVLPGAGTFAGELLHSSALKSAEAQLAGRRVLVVGGGESGSDVSLLAARVASSCCLSMRSGPGYIIPRTTFGLPSDIDTSRAYHSLPRWLMRRGALWHAVKLWLEGWCGAGAGGVEEARVLAAAQALNDARGRGPFERFGTKNTSLCAAAVRHGMRIAAGVVELDAAGARFADGSRFDCDVVVLCTGFKLRLPFLESSHPTLAAAMVNGRNCLYLRAFHPDLGATLSACGLVRPGLGAIPPLAEMQARAIAGVVAGRLALPPPPAMRAAIAATAAADARTYPDDAKRVAALTDYAPLMDALAGLLGVRPPSTLKLLASGHWRLAWRLQFSSLSGAQFRLAGPGACWETAAPAIAAYPPVPLPVALWELAAGCLCRVMAAMGWSSWALLMQ